MAVLALAVLAAAYFGIAHLRDPLAFDAQHTYLPMAKRFLAEGWAFMQSPDSLIAGPVAYIYPALFGAEPTAIRWGNVVLYCLTVLLGFHACRRALSWTAGLIAALLLAFSPLLHPFVTEAMTEPPFFFLVAAWAACTAEAAHQGASKRGYAWAAAAGVALALATFTRPAIMYFAPAMALLLAAKIGVRHLFSVTESFLENRCLTPIFGCGIAAALVAAWIVRNVVTFGFASVATGAGAAMFFGVNPLVNGYEPAYYGMNYDSGAVQTDLHHLALGSDRRLREVAVFEAMDTPIGALADMMVKKTAAFLLVSSAENSEPHLARLRLWRIAMLVLAAVALLYRWRQPVVMMLGALFAYMVAAHVPAFYLHRYSVGAIEIPLTLLAAIGAAEAMASARRAAITASVATIAMAAGLIQLQDRGPLAPMPERIPHEVVWMRAIDERHAAGPGSAPIDIAIGKRPGTPPWDLSLIALDLGLERMERGTSCNALRLRYRHPEDAEFADWRTTRVALEPAEGMKTRFIGTTVPLTLDREGTLRLELECNGPAVVRIGSLAVIKPLRHIHYRDRFLAAHPEKR
jgi:hypothetical protein